LTRLLEIERQSTGRKRLDALGKIGGRLPQSRKVCAINRRGDESDWLGGIGRAARRDHERGKEREPPHSNRHASSLFLILADSLQTSRAPLHSLGSQDAGTIDPSSVGFRSLGASDMVQRTQISGFFFSV
jgi:hypothetical protein